MARVAAELGDAEDQRAWFTCALCLAGRTALRPRSSGGWKGSSAGPHAERGDSGYDPMFIPSGQGRTFGEMEPEEKHAISHRARAFEQLLAACFG